MYTITKERVVIVSDSFGTPLCWYVKDTPSLHRESQKLLEKYIKDASEKFKLELETLLSTKRNFTQADKDRLNAIFTSLLDVRTIWEEEERNIS